MEYRRRSKDQMGRSKSEVLCKKHPKHRQSPGVCSICLRERLSQLSTSSRSATAAIASPSSSSSVSSYSSSDASSCSSPMHRYRFPSDAKPSFFLSSGKNVLTKSRSVAFVTCMRAGEGEHRNKKSGFWSKLLRPRRKRNDEVLVYSRTVRERIR